MLTYHALLLADQDIISRTVEFFLHFFKFGWSLDDIVVVEDWHGSSPVDHGFLGWTENLGFGCLSW